MSIDVAEQSALALMRTIAGEFADRFLDEILFAALHKASRSSSPSQQSICDALLDPYSSLEAIYSHYAFARRGKDRQDLSDIALEALSRTCRPEAISHFLALPNASILWENFEIVCSERRRKPMPQLNQGVIAGLAELAQEIYRLDGVGSITRWVLEGVKKTDRIEPVFFRMVDVRGVGPKLSALFLRDVTHLYELEDRIDHADRLYVQPVDKWVRALAPYIVPEQGIERAADWVLAGKVAKYTRRAGLSGIRFNMGSTHFGLKEARQTEGLDSAIRKITRNSDSMPFQAVVSD